MKKLTLLFVLFSAAFLFAQDSQSQCANAHVSISASASGISSSGSAQAASIEDAGVCVTKAVSLVYEQIDAPSRAVRYQLGMVNYNRSLASVFGKKLSARFVFDPAPWSVDVYAGVGMVKQDVTGATGSIAEAAGAGLRYQGNGHLGFRVISFEYLHGKTGSGSNLILFTPNNWNVSSGPVFSF